MKLILIIFALFAQCSLFSAQDYFIYNYHRHNNVTNQYEFLCFGGFMKNNFILVPASCLTEPDPFNFWNLYPPGGYAAPNRFQMHPYFNFSDPNYGNVGRVAYPHVTVSNMTYTGRDITLLPQTQTRCQIHSWDNEDLENKTLINYPVDVLPPSSCGNDSPHTHCTIVQPADVANICRFKLGAPLICDGSTISGYVISPNGCETRNGSTILRYNSVSAYEEWMEFGLDTTIAVSTPSTTTQGAAQSNLAKFGILVVILMILFMNK